MMADIQFNLRIPEELKDKIKEAATDNGRSINAEAQYRLEQSFSDNHEKEIQYWKDEAFELLGQLKKLIQKDIK
ncbi:Arc family DNA-binding protein [Acinetobacter junii]|uniref:Arc family DNA-binding protein n=1 Tax=Acinetobacter junii TaxID=40215 RepID=UPI002DB75A6B|nr:Arc family DNA-binding protein [Acinetobacter junii]MEB8381431.1 Arc family DNA-binding protein [Acinetobacter junii]